MNIVVFLRGHERNTFNNERLRQFINTLRKSLKTSVHVHIHTWEKTEARLSWRNLNIISRTITKSEIENYFDTDITCNIESEDDVKIHGNTLGKIGAIPIICWKRMWYGQYSGIRQILSKFNEDTTLILNMRIDFFSCNTTHKYRITEDHLINMLKKAIETPEKITFIHNTGEYDGIDNVFASNLNIMHKLIRHFHFNLDDISSKYNYLMFHENMVYYESEILCGNTINIDPFVYYGRLLSNQIINHFAGI